MTVTITIHMVIYALGIFFTWSGCLIGIIKLLLKREVENFKAGITTANSKADQALSAISNHKEASGKQFEELRSELIKINDKPMICTNHMRMENNDQKLFERLDQLHGDIRELTGTIKGMANRLDIINEHLMNGGR